jgi:ribosome-associated protein
MDELTARALALAEARFLAASGPGGQNVNKVATAVQLRLDAFALRLEPARS